MDAFSPDTAGRPALPEALGNSEAFVAFQERLSRAAKVNRPVLIVGERGTGKELAVHRLHYLSQRWQGPLVALNGAALNENVLESELFGHEAGAFTGATRRREGRFELADGGTLFLDEIGLLPLVVQEKILRVVEYGAFERVGGNAPIHVDARLIGATNADLVQLVEEGRFKDDLLDRLSFEVLRLPPLRERAGDIPLLAAHFAARMARELGREALPDFTSSALERLEAHAFPGNIRELKNLVERAVYRSPRARIAPEHLDFDPFAAHRNIQQMVPPKPTGRSEPDPPATEPSRTPAGGLQLPFTWGSTPFNEAAAQLERHCLQEALRRCGHHQGRAARLLGLSYHQFRGLYRKHRDSIAGPAAPAEAARS